MKFKQIFTISKSAFENKFTNNDIKSYFNSCFISVLDPDNFEFKFNTNMNNFLQVKMWDIEYDIFNEKGELIYQKPQDEEIKKIVDFINKNKDKNSFIIHCSAGISRSGAIARFIKEKFPNEVNDNLFNKNNKHIMPNLYIFNRLKELDNLK